LGRRIAKKVDGTLVEKYLWQGLTRLLAVYDGSDNLLMRFEYADGRMPVAMTKEGIAYYMTYDQVGSLRVVADASGNVVKRIEHDSFGNIINDTNPSFTIPFGFAGGLHDPDTNLIRFGFRDYDPDIGRWTAKDPILFAGGDTDLYGYCLGDPVNFVDPLGLFEWVNPITYWRDFGGGAYDFLKNYQDMREAGWRGADKYFHCKANCEAAQRGLGGEVAACLISETREWLDQNIKRYPAADSAADQAANQYGRTQGALNPGTSCAQICAPFRPPDLPPKY